MQKICVVILLSALLSHYEALPQTKWSRPIHNTQGRSIRERRQFSFGEWVPLSQPCPTCRQFADPLDVGLKSENIGLTPPRPPTVTRQIHGEANFFPDESSILSVPPPPPSAIPRHPSANFQFSSFGSQFNNPLPTQQIFPQTQQIQFLPQTFLPNQQVLVNNQQILPGLNQQQNNVFRQDQGKQVNSGKVINFNNNNNFKSQKISQNILLEQNNRAPEPKQTFSNKPQPFTQQQQTQQQGVINQPQQSFAFGSSVLTPPPAPNNTQNIAIPGLEKEEIQLLYVPVETLRQRGNFRQQQLINEDSQSIQFQKRPSSSVQRPVNNIQQTKQTQSAQGKGRFVEQSKNNVEQTINNYQVTTPQPFSSTASPSTVLFHNLPFQQTPQPFVSATPVSPTIQPFVTPSLGTQKFSPFTPETTLPQLSTIPNTIQFSPQNIEFGTTPKTVLNQGAFQDEIINGKSQFPSIKNTVFLNQEQPTPTQQTFTKQQETPSPQSQQPAFFPEQQKQITGQNNFQQQIYLQRQQEQQRLLQEQEEKEKQLRLRQQKELEAQRLLQQQRLLQEQEEKEKQLRLRQQKELEAQRLLQQRQKELEEQRLLQQKEQKEQLLLQQQRQKELEQQRFLQQQKEKELEQQRVLQQQREKELEQQRILQQQRERELEQQRILLEQQKELEIQRRIQLQKQKELEEKRRLQQQKQKQEEDQLRLLRIQKQQEQREEQRLLQQQQEQQRLLQQQKLQRQKEENIRNQQQIQYLQQQQQQKQISPQQVFQQTNRHVLPAQDNLNLIPQAEKEAELENKQLVPHQPPLSVFYKGSNPADSQIVDVLRELRSSNSIIVLDQYFEKMPKVFVGPAGLIPPSGYRKFDLPYLSNLETNRIEKRIDKLPFFVAPVNFVPPLGYAKILFPAPHVGSVVVSSEFNPAMKLGSPVTDNPVISDEEKNNGGFHMVGPELPGLINSLETETTTIKPVTIASTPSLPQTTAQLRSKRPNNTIYKPQSRKPISKTRAQTTSKPEYVTQSYQRTETPKDSSETVRKPFNRFLHRRRQQTTTESSLKAQNGKSLENRHYSVEVYNEDTNADNFPQTQQKNNILQNTQNEEYQYNEQVNQKADEIDRTTPGGHGVFRVQPTPEYYKTQTVKGSSVSEVRSPGRSDYSDINLQSFEDGPLPTGSAKTITHQLYRPNSIRLPGREISYQPVAKPENTEKFQSVSYEDTSKFSAVPTASAEHSQSVKQHSEEQFTVHSTPVPRLENEDGSVETVYSEEVAKTENPFTQNPGLSAEQQANSFLGSNEEFTSALAELSKHHKMTRPSDSPKSHNLQFSTVRPVSEASVELGTPVYQEQSEEFGSSNEGKVVQFTVPPSRSPSESYSSEFDRNLTKTQFESDSSDVISSPVSPIPTEAVQDSLHILTGHREESQTQNYGNNQQEDQRINSFISLDNVHSTPESLQSQPQYLPSPTPSTFQVTVTESEKYPEYPERISSTPVSVAEVTSNPSAKAQSFETASVGLRNYENTQTSGVGSQNVVDGGSNEPEIKLPNPSIVKVRTRGRNRPRGQVNFAASQSTTPAPYTRSKTEHRTNENTEQEQPVKTGHFRDYQQIKSIKPNPYRGLKKPIRTTTEPVTESEYKSNVYTIRPQRRPSNPSTVSTKRIRRPTSPIPSTESATEAFGLSSPEPYYQSEHSDFSPSGVSNDVYYEHSSLSPVRQKFRKFSESAEQKSDVINVFGSTHSPVSEPVAPAISQTEIYEETNIGKNPELTSVEVQHPENIQEHSEKFPEWNPSESGFDVSGIVLTTIRVPTQEETGDEEPKKYQDSKKAFDPDLEKKSGRRRVRIRVHKRPHENFETAESQNLRTVANVLVPPTSTYKPTDESNFHVLAKNADFSFGGQKLFGSRSREYFKKRLNLTQTEGVSKEEKNLQNVNLNKNSESQTGVEKEGEVQRNGSENVRIVAHDGSEEGKVSRPKYRGFVRKIVKHGHASKEESKSSESAENEDNEGKHGNVGVPLRQHIGANFTGRYNGTRHKGFVRFVKKNKIRTHEAEIHHESTSQEHQKTELTTTESHLVDTPETLHTESKHDKLEEVKEEVEEIVQSTISPDKQHTQRSDEVRTKTSEPPKIESTELKTSEAPKIEEGIEVSSEKPEKPEESHSETPATPQAGLYLTQKPKFYQTLRPLYYRPSHSGFQRTREHTSTTEQTVQNTSEKKDVPVRPKYGKPTGSSTQESGKQEESKRFNEQQQRQKSQHTQEVRKYLRTKSRDGVFSQFSKNKYFSHQKTENEVTTKESSKKESEEFIPVDTKSSLSDIEFPPYKPTTEVVAEPTDSSQTVGETTKHIGETDIPTTTETVEGSTEEERSSEERSSEEESSEEEDITSTTKLEETTTEFRTEPPTSVYQTTSQITSDGKTETEKAENENFDSQPDIYRFSKSSFSFDETEKFTGTKNRAHVRNITTEIIENTASFSAPGVEKQPEIRVVTRRVDEKLPTTTESQTDVTSNQKTEETTEEFNTVETTTDLPETAQTQAEDKVTKSKIAKVLKTSTTTKISHETEICYKGKCIRTKSENPDEDLKKLVDSASIMKIEKAKT